MELLAGRNSSKQGRSNKFQIGVEKDQIKSQNNLCFFTRGKQGMHKIKITYKKTENRSS